MMKILEYIFIRMYLKYKKEGDPALIASSGYIFLILFFTNLFIIFLLKQILNEVDHWVKTLLFLIYLLLILFFVLFKFTLKLDKHLFKFKNEIKCKDMKDWYFYFVLPFSIIFGVGLTYIMNHLLIQWLHLDNVIQDLF